MAGADLISVDTDDRQQAHDIDVERYAGLLRSSLLDCDVAVPSEVGLAFVGVEEMAALNTDYMSGSGPTDVLAFPIDGADRVPDGQPSMIGDIVICPEVAARAPQSLDDELALLIVHAALHLVGHDHAEPAETTQMKARQAELLARHYRLANSGVANQAGGNSGGERR